METRVDQRLSTGINNQKAGWRSQVHFCRENLHFLFRVTYVADWKDIMLNEKHNKYYHDDQKGDAPFLLSDFNSLTIGRKYLF